MKDQEEIDLLQLHMARQDKEKSRALPADHYGNPARTVKFESEKKREERLPRKGAKKWK